MVSNAEVNKQLKAIGFSHTGWGQGEVSELSNILLPDEHIHECVNGIYEGGFALLVATDIRLLLIDKKPLNYLTVEDLRFDMINEMDYSHRLLGARISIATGSKNLQFRSYNQARLRKLIGHVQHSMAEAKRTLHTHHQDQSLHLERINQQLQAYLVAQQQQQLQMQQAQLAQQLGRSNMPEPAPVKPAPELADYLFAQSLLAQHSAQLAQQAQQPRAQNVTEEAAQTQMQEMYAQGMQEVFGKAQPTLSAKKPLLQVLRPLELTPRRIAHAKLPMVLRNRRFSSVRHSNGKEHPMGFRLDLNGSPLG